DNEHSYDNIGLQVYAKNAANQNAFYPINTGMYCSGVSDYFTSSGGINTGINCFGSGKGNINYGIYASADYATTNYAIYGTYYSGTPGTKYAGYFNGNIGGTGIFSYTSDEKLKKDIKQESGMVNRIMQLQPSNYTFRTGEFGAMNLAEGLHHGLIAQQLKTVFPELVSEQVFPAQYDAKTHKITQEEVKYLGVNYIELIPVLISGMQEQQKQIDQLTKELNELKGSGSTTLSSSDANKNVTPGESYLLQNAPNPFSQFSQINYSISSNVKNAVIIVHDLNGNIVRSFDNLKTGNGSVSLAAGSLASGTYSYSLILDGTPVETRNFVITR
ncbi:MAG: tail fiber domain-containing protein, partial [Chitinophagales bacterium]